MIRELSPISCVVSGSFTKHKAEIDHDIIQFQSRGIKVPSPPLGPLMKPLPDTLWRKGAYPVGDERYQNELAVKKAHTQWIKKVDFVYFENKNRYLGNSVLAELMVAVIHGKYLYSREPFEPEFDDFEPKWLNLLQSIVVMPPEEVAEVWNHGRPGGNLYIPEYLALERQGFVDHMIPYEMVIYGGGKITLDQAKAAYAQTLQNAQKST